MEKYEAPKVTELGSVQDLTLASIIHKNAGSGDVIVINGVQTSADGNGVTSVS